MSVLLLETVNVTSTADATNKFFQDLLSFYAHVRPLPKAVKITCTVE